MRAFPKGIGGPDLAGAGNRLTRTALTVQTLSPQSGKRGSRMPSLFSGKLGDSPEEKRKNGIQRNEEVDALVHFLSSTKPRQPLPKALAGNVEHGKKLYHTIGCAVCHGPVKHQDADHRRWIALGQFYTHDALVSYLLDPKSELMPSLKLRPKEAADLAAWIHSHHNPPGPVSEKKTPVSEELAKKGSDLFVSRRCVSCHGEPGMDLPDPPRPVRIVNWDRGCLSAEPVVGTPHYDLTDRERDAIRAAASSPVPKSPAEVIDHFLTLYNCYTCHQRGGKGGPSDKQRPLFTATEQMAESYGDFGTIPPKLDHAGRKLTRTWLRKILLEGHGEVRPYLATRMPHYRIPEARVEQFITALEEVDRREPPVTIDVSGLLGHQRGHHGRNLMGTKGLNCITCHGLKGRRALGAPSIDLTHTVQRLRPAYFKELLLDPQSVQPGTLMPPLFLNRPKASQEVEQLWTYFKELDQRRPPDGLLRTGDFELFPAKEGKPIVLRTFLENVGTHAIAVGYPQGTHLAFDSRTSQWALLWKGRFLDAMSTWDDRYATPAKPLGKDLHRFVRTKTKRTFRGFRLTDAGIPVFLYEENGVLVEDRIAPLPDGKLRRTIKRGNNVEFQHIHLHEGKATFRDEN